MTKRTTLAFDDWFQERMRDPEVRAAVKAREPAYQIARLRMQRGLTQKELAKLVGTRQSSIARLESGKQPPSLSFLHKVVEALDGWLEVYIVADGEVLSLCQENIEIRSSAATNADAATVTSSSAPALLWHDHAQATA